MTECKNTYDTCLIRGAKFERVIGFLNGYEEVIEDPSDFSAVWVFRADQDDALTNLLTLSATPVAVVEPNPARPQVLATFTATPAQTQALPQYDLVYYVELTQLSDPDNVVRVFEGKVDVRD